jgi:hypothetical protein
LAGNPRRFIDQGREGPHPDIDGIVEDSRTRCSVHWWHDAHDQARAPSFASRTALSLYIVCRSGGEELNGGINSDPLPGLGPKIVRNRGGFDLPQIYRYHSESSL